jgi:hypothetical protein
MFGNTVLIFYQNNCITAIAVKQLFLAFSWPVGAASLGCKGDVGPRGIILTKLQSKINNDVIKCRR